MNEAGIGTGEAPAEIEQEGIPEEEFAKISQAYTEYMNWAAPEGKKTDQIVKGLRSNGESTFRTSEHWQDVFLPRKKIMDKLEKDCKIDRFKQHIHTLFGVMGSEFTQKQIADASEAYAADSTEENLKKIHTFQMTSAKWQGDCVEMIRDFEDFPGGEELIALMWEKLDYFSAQARAFSSRKQDWKSLQTARLEGIGNARKLKYGTLSPRLVGDTVGFVTKGLNISFQTSTPSEDVRGGTDMVLVNEDNQMRCAMQVKSSHQGIGTIECKGIEEIRYSNGSMSEEEKAEIDRDNKFLKKVRKNKIADVAMWVKVLGTKDDVNQTTGKPGVGYLKRQNEQGMGLSIRQLLRVVHQRPEVVAA